MRCLFHLHTSASKDSILDRCTLLVLCRLHHIDGIAITDHDEIRHALAWRVFFQRHGIQVIPGEEIFTSEGEIIGLFLTERVAPGQTPETTVAAIRAQGGLVYIPHPFDEKRHRSVLRPEALERIQAQVDVVEIHNGRNKEAWYDDRQRAICERVGAVPIIGADAHTWFEVGRNVIDLPAFHDRATLLTALRSPACHFHPQPGLPLAHVVTKCVRFGKLLGKGEFRELQRIFARKLGGRKPASRGARP